jgi:transcription-repair coupling factor (superfamily II helicase)
MPTTTPITNSNQNRKRGLDSDLQNGKRVRFSEEEQIFKILSKNEIDRFGENPRRSDDFFDRHTLKMAAQTKYPEGSKEQIRAIRAALTSTVSSDITVLNDTLITLENNLTYPNAKRKYIKLLSTRPELIPLSMYWDPYKERTEGIKIKN